MEHIQRATIQLQVVVNGKRKLEQTATSYTAPRHAFRSCLSCGHHTGLFLPLPAPPINRRSKCKSRQLLIPASQNAETTTILCFCKNLYNANYSQPLSSGHTKDCNLNLALYRFSWVGAGNQANSLF